MKIAFAGKGGAGKTTLTAWTADYLTRQGHDVWLIDADTALSLGLASGLKSEDLPVPLVQQEKLILERIGAGGIISLTPHVADLPESLAVYIPQKNTTQHATTGKKLGSKRLLVMGSIAAAGGGCACEANALLKALLAHLVLDRNSYVLVDLEAGVEHLGRGTVAAVDALVVVSEPSFRSLEVAAHICSFASDLGLQQHFLVLNRSSEHTENIPELPHLPEKRMSIPPVAGLLEKMLHSGSVLELPEQPQIDSLIASMLGQLQAVNTSP